MEYLNRIELRGVVGSVRRQNVGGENIAMFSVCTPTIEKSEDSAIVETTWHSVVAFESSVGEDLSKLDKGSKVHIIGRLRTNPYTDTKGQERIAYEVVAHIVELIDE